MRKRLPAHVELTPRTKIRTFSGYSPRPRRSTGLIKSRLPLCGRAATLPPGARCLPSKEEFHFCVVSARRATKLEGVRDIVAVQTQLQEPSCQVKTNSSCCDCVWRRPASHRLGMSTQKACRPEFEATATDTGDLCVWRTTRPLA